METVRPSGCGVRGWGRSAGPWLAFAHVAGIVSRDRAEVS